MSKLEELLNKLCSDGVEFIKLDKCLSYEQPTKYIVKCKDYIETGLPVLTAGQTFILGYTDETEGIFCASKDNPVIIFDDFTTSFHWVDFDFKIKSSAMKMLRPRADMNISFRFVYYAMKCIKYQTLEHSRQWISKYSQLEIPLPPMEVQNEIVRILDCFTQLEAELEAELDCRKRQYEFYRDQLLSFDKLTPPERNNVVWKKLSEVGTFIRGKRFVRTDIVEHGVPCIHYGDIYTYYGLTAQITRTFLMPEKAAKMRFAQKNDVIIVAAGENNMDIGVGVAWIGDEKVAVHDACFIFRSDLHPRYLSHYLRGSDYHIQIKKYVSEGKICSISAQNLGKAVIAIPPLKEQERIANILDRFESLTTSLQHGLPAEIAARRQQYEYYRDKLLDFKRKTA